VAQAVRADPRGAGDAGPFGEAADELIGDRVAQPRGGVGVEEDRSAGPLADVGLECVQDDRRERLGRCFSALAHDPQHAVSALVAEVLDVAGEDLGDPQPVVDEQADQRRRPGPVRLGGGEEAVELVGGQPDGGGVV
jgi:hypothetical protein